MKKSSFSSYLLISMVTISLCCYVYLHKVAFKVTGHCPSASATMVSDENETETSKILLPDIALVKRFIKIYTVFLDRG